MPPQPKQQQPFLLLGAAAVPLSELWLCLISPGGVLCRLKVTSPKGTGVSDNVEVCFGLPCAKILLQGRSG